MVRQRVPRVIANSTYGERKTSIVTARIMRLAWANRTRTSVITGSTNSLSCDVIGSELLQNGYGWQQAEHPGE